MKPTADFTITTKSGRVLSAADIDRMADEAAEDPGVIDPELGVRLRQYKGGYDVAIDGPLFAVWLDDDLDAGLSAAAAERSLSAAELMRRAVAAFIERQPETHDPQPEADLSGWQWLLHLDADLAARVQAFAGAEGCHLNAVVNHAVRQTLDSSSP